MKKILFSVFMLAGIAANAQKQPTPTDTAVITEMPAKPDVRYLGKAETTTTVTTTTTGRRKKKRETIAQAKAAEQHKAPKDTVSVKGDTIRVIKNDSVKAD